ncbi:MAG TPA: hypothetical protein VLA12_12315 [Planctomycetaceae bacterium]|nr:hypothetical protein [Planctomycetaceae bacterium]
MSDQSPLSSSETVEPQQPANSEKSKPGLTGLGKRIASRTTDLVAVGILLIAGLSMGGSVIRWWNTEPEDLTLQSSQAFVDRLIPPDWESGLPVGIAVGNSTLGMERAELSGPREEIEQMLSEEILTRCERATIPNAPPDERETRMLESLETVKPVRTIPEGVRVYLKDGPLIWCVGLKSSSSGGQSPNQSDVSDSRVVCWGFAFPSGFDSARWSVWLMWPGGDRQNSSEYDWRGVLPDSSVCSLALTSPHGHVLLAFTGTGSHSVWSKELESRFREREFVLENVWKSGSNGLTGRFISRRNGSERVAFVQVSVSIDNQFRGLIQISAEDQKEITP